MPCGTKAAKLWPAEPLKCSLIVSSGRPAGPWRRGSGPPTLVPTTRWTLRIAHFVGDEAHEVDDMLGRAHELGAQLRILRGDADRARVQMADAHHDAAQRDERAGREAELLGAEQSADDHVTAGLELAVDLDGD